MKTLDIYFQENKTRKGNRAVYKNTSYQHIYEHHFSRFIDTEMVICELGIGYGGCLQMWKEYFGPKCTIIGIDKNDQGLYEESQISCILANQANGDDLEMLANRLPKMDIFIDDGSHVNLDQINTFEKLFPLVKEGGLYVCEDTHTSYRGGEYGGGYLKKGTFLEYCKTLTDCLNYSEDVKIPATNNTNLIWSVSFFASMVIIQKKPKGVL